MRLKAAEIQQLPKTFAGRIASNLMQSVNQQNFFSEYYS